MSSIDESKPPILDSSAPKSDYLRIIITMSIYVFIAVIFIAISGFAEAMRNWEKYRCKPQYMALAPLFGKDTAQNMDYCMKGIMEKEAGPFLAPVFKILASFVGTFSVLLNSTNSLRLQLATLVGGITRMIQQFTDRFAQFIFSVRRMAIRIKSLLYRVYGTLIAAVYMGLTSLTAAQNVGDSLLFVFVNTICFPPDTPIYVKSKGHIRIDQIKIGDRLAHGGKVTATFKFLGKGQPMVRLGHVRVSTNHFVRDPEGKWVMASEHPHAIQDGVWEHGPDKPLICLNTDDHKIPLGGYMFSDYDETSEGDKEAATFVERSLNGFATESDKQYKEYGALMHPGTSIDNCLVKDIKLGHIMQNGAKVIGVLKKLTSEYVELPDGTRVTPSTLVWDSSSQTYKRAISINNAKYIELTEPTIYYGLMVNPHSYVTTDSGLHLRDYFEVMSPFTEESYAASLRASHIKAE